MLIDGFSVTSPTYAAYVAQPFFFLTEAQLIRLGSCL